MALPRIECAVSSCRQIEAQYEWKFEKFFSPLEKEDVCYISPDIQFSGRTFKITLFNYLASDVFQLVLYTEHPISPITIRYTMGIKTPAGDTEVWASGTHEFSRSDYFAPHKSGKRSELWNRRKELAPCDDLTITACLKTDASGLVTGTTDVAVQTSVEAAKGHGANEGRQELENTGTTEVAVQTSFEDAKGHEANRGRQTLENTDFAALAQSFKDLYVAGKDCDVTLEVKDKKFRAHKLILGARTPVLAAMFSHNTKESATGIVRVEDCHPEAFEVFLGFVYSGTVENLTGENVSNVYYIADKYEVPGLKDICVLHMVCNLAASSVCNVITLADRHGEELLQKKATEFLIENAREIFQTSFWRKFMAENNRLAYDLINRALEKLK